jgi:hypothetical protein
LKYIAFTNNNFKLRTIDFSDLNYNISVTTVTSNTVLTFSNNYVKCNGTFNLVLPDIDSKVGVINIKNIGSGVITILSVNSQTIDGEEEFILSTTGSAIQLVSDGTNWFVW